MIDIIIVSENMKYSIALLNKISERVNNIRVSCIFNIKEKIEDTIIKNYILLIDYELIKYNDYIKFKKYEKNLIVLVDEKKIKTINRNKDNYILKDNINEIIEKIYEIYYIKRNFMLKNKYEDIKEKIECELMKIGYNFNYIGTKYLLDVIFIISILNKKNNFNLQREIYPIIAKKYGKDINNIKCNIRNATDIMYYENDEIKIKNYLGHISYSKSITTKTVIIVILKKINS